MYTELSSSSSAENIKFKYSVEWKENRAYAMLCFSLPSVLTGRLFFSVTFDNRREHHSQHSFFPQEQEARTFPFPFHSLTSFFLL